MTKTDDNGFPCQSIENSEMEYKKQMTDKRKDEMPDAETQARWILKDVVGLTWDDSIKSIHMTPRSFTLCIQAAISRNCADLSPPVPDDVAIEDFCRTWLHCGMEEAKTLHSKMWTMKQALKENDAPVISMPPVDTIAVPREVSVIDTTIKSNIPEHWQVPSYGEGPCIGEVVVTRFQDKQRAISQANKQRPLMPADKVRDIRDGSQRTWRIIEVSAYYDRTKIVLRDVNDEKNVITADYDRLTPYLELVAAPLASLDAVLSEGKNTQ